MLTIVVELAYLLLHDPEEGQSPQQAVERALPALGFAATRDLMVAYYKRLQAGEGRTEALRQVKEARPDVILLDIMVPHLNGWEICRRLKQDPAAS